MNTARIQEAVKQIDRCKLALDWMEKCGANVATDPASFLSFNPSVGGRVDGFSEASTKIEAHAMKMLPEIIKIAMQDCRNTIELSRAAIAEEAQP